MEYEERWEEVWSEACEAFATETGEAPKAKLKPEEASLLRSLVLSSLEVSKRLKQIVSEQSVESLKRCLQNLVLSAWKRQDANDALERAGEHERSGRWEEAREAYSEALLMGPSQTIQCSLAFAQLLHVMATEGSGEGGASEQILRHALDGSGPRAVLAKLILLLLQEGRDEEAVALLRSGDWKFRLAPWVMRPDDEGMECAGFPGCVLDNAIPESFLQHLQGFLSRESKFWLEHEYNEVSGSGKAGYFSYVQQLLGEATSTLDVIIRHVWELLKARGAFPELGEATVAEWWAHKRPHACGHQMHYDSDNEGIGGVRNPICSCVIFVEAPAGIGGATLVTDQSLPKRSLGTKGWLITPSPGRLAAYDGTYFHGVVPGRGASPGNGRRITFMIAYWKTIQQRPFQEDGLPGSSRPLPNPAEPFEVGPRRYTWHQQLALPLPLEFDTSPKEVSLRCWKPLWTDIEGKALETCHDLPDIQQCFQF